MPSIASPIWDDVLVKTQFNAINSSCLCYYFMDDVYSLTIRYLLLTINCLFLFQYSLSKMTHPWVKDTQRQVKTTHWWVTNTQWQVKITHWWVTNTHWWVTTTHWWVKITNRWVTTTHWWVIITHRWVTTTHRWVKITYWLVTTTHRWVTTTHRWITNTHRWVKTTHRWASPYSSLSITLLIDEYQLTYQFGWWFIEFQPDL